MSTQSAPVSRPDRPRLPVGTTFTPFFGGRGRTRSVAVYDPHFPGAREAREAEANRGTVRR